MTRHPLHARITSLPCALPFAASLLVAAGAALLPGCTPSYDARVAVETSAAPDLPPPLASASMHLACDSDCGSACGGTCAEPVTASPSPSPPRTAPAGLADVLSEALDDEYRSLATYQAVIGAFGDIRPFANIVHAERRHADALLALFEAYDIPPPEDHWTGRVHAPASPADACRDAAEAERRNAEMYDRLLESQAAASEPDVTRVLTALRDASQLRHLPAFERCVARGGEPGESGEPGDCDGRGACRRQGRGHHQGQGRGQGRGRGQGHGGGLNGGGGRNR